MANKIRVHDKRMSNVIIVEKILWSLKNKFNYIVCSIEESKDIDSLSINKLQSCIIVREHKFHKHDRKEQALKIAYKDRLWGKVEVEDHSEEVTIEISMVNRIMAHGEGMIDVTIIEKIL